MQHHIRITELVQNGKTGTNSREFRDRWQLERSMMEGKDATEDIMEQYIHRGKPLPQVLRLLCLQVAHIAVMTVDVTFADNNCGRV